MFTALSSFVSRGSPRKSQTQKNRKRIQQRHARRRQLMSERLEDRRLLALQITTPIMGDDWVNAAEYTSVSGARSYAR